MDNTFRAGFFTSSQGHKVVASLKSGKPSQTFHTYVKEVFSETLIKRVGDVEIKARPVLWGSLMETVLFDRLDMGWTMTHKQTLTHKEYSDFWSGTPDFIAQDKIAEAKCYYPKNFGLLSAVLNTGNIGLLEDEFPKEYWQCISNAILCEKDTAVLIAFMPYKKDLLELLEKIEDTAYLEERGLAPEDYYWLTRADIEQLPYLPDESPMSDINMMEFKVPEESKDFITERMILANSERNNLIEKYK